MKTELRFGKGNLNNTLRWSRCSFGVRDRGKRVTNGEVGCHLWHLHQPLELDNPGPLDGLIYLGACSVTQYSVPLLCDWFLHEALTSHTGFFSTVQGETPSTPFSFHIVCLWWHHFFLLFLYWWQQVASDAESDMAGGHRQRPWELVTLPCINSPVKAVAKVQSQEGLHVCQLMNLPLCGCYIGTRPPGNHCLHRQKSFSRWLKGSSPASHCAEHSCSHSKRVFWSGTFSSVFPRAGPRWRGGKAGTVPRESGPPLHFRAVWGRSLQAQLLPQ